MDGVTFLSLYTPSMSSPPFTPPGTFHLPVVNGSGR